MFNRTIFICGAKVVKIFELQLINEAIWSGIWSFLIPFIGIYLQISGKEPDPEIKRHRIDQGGDHFIGVL